MLFAGEDHRRVAAGEIRLAFRRWERQRVYAGRSYRTPSGRLLVDEVCQVGLDAIGDDDARLAGRDDTDARRAGLRGDPAWPVFRIAFHLDQSADPRDELAGQRQLSPTQLAEVDARLAGSTRRVDMVPGPAPYSA